MELKAAAFVPSLNPVFQEQTPPSLQTNSCKVGQVSYHIFSSYLGGMAMKTAFAGLLAYCVITQDISVLLPKIGLTVQIALGSITATWLIDVFRLRKHLLFEISLLYTIKTARNWMDRVTDHIILSAIPLKNHEQFIKDANVKAVLTMLEDSELHPGLVQPLLKDDYVKANIDHLQIPAPDYLGVALPQIIQGVEFLNQKIQNNETVLVHCKAGRGRSTTIVMCWLLMYGTNGQTFPNFEDAFAWAYELVKAKRPQINLNANQRLRIKEFWQNQCQK